MDMLRDRIAGALYGVAVGGRLGRPLGVYERRGDRQKIRPGQDHAGRRVAWPPAGETTDDTAMTLAVAEGIMERPEAPFQAIGARFIKWAKSGPKDIGGTCGSSICRAMTARRRVSTFPSLERGQPADCQTEWKPKRRERSPHAGYLPWPLLSPPR